MSDNEAGPSSPSILEGKQTLCVYRGTLKVKSTLNRFCVLTGATRHVPDCIVCEGNLSTDGHEYTPPSQLMPQDDDDEVEIFEKTPKAPAKGKAKRKKQIVISFTAPKNTRVNICQKNCKVIRKSKVYIHRLMLGPLKQHIVTIDL